MSSIVHVLAGSADVLGVGPGAREREELAVLPGSFNPLHEGHLEMAQVAERWLARTVHFEISIANVEKAPLEESQCRARMAQFADHHTLWLTRAATFVEKAQLFPRATFVVGIDTILRIVEPAYYEAAAHQRDQAIEQLAAAGCRFLVFGRRVNEQFLVLAELTLPAALRELCREVPEADFRRDVSSSQQRG